MTGTNTELIIGVLGGMGTYATIHLFRQYAMVFPAEKEWERPRIIIDNRCTMPSRVRAFLYNENRDILISQMTESLEGLVKAGCSKIILACNTSHLYLNDILKSSPMLEDYIVNMIDACAEEIIADGGREAYLLATEGTIESGVYQMALSQKENVICNAPEVDEYPLLRACIEAVKQNNYTQETRDIFCELVNRHENCILGCTELPILYEMYADEIRTKRIYDPGLITLKKIHRECFE